MLRACVPICRYGFTLLLDAAMLLPRRRSFRLIRVATLAGWRWRRRLFRHAGVIAGRRFSLACLPSQYTWSHAARHLFSLITY